MTTITSEKELLDRALESMCWAARILNIDPDEAPNYHWSLENIRSALAAPATAPATAPEQCWCRTCRPITQADNRMVLCPDCGNKRCPKATDHRNACTGSNEPGQPGSSYPTVPATALEQLDPADLCDVCGEPVRYGSRHHACGDSVLRANATSPPATAPAQPEIVDLLAEMYDLILANKVVLAEKSGGVWTWPDRAIEAVRKHRSGPAQPERKPTTRKAFESEARKHGFILDRLDKSGKYVQLITEQAWGMWQAATAAALERAAEVCDEQAKEPAWHDAPTCAGLWFCDEGDENPYRFTCHNVSIPLNPHLVGEGERWYGPIPEDKP